VTIISILLAIFFGGSMALLMGMIEALQILTFIPLLSLELQGFVLVFYKQLAIVNFQILDFSPIFNIVLPDVDLLHNEPKDVTFEFMGFETQNILYNCADIIFTLMILSKILKVVVNKGLKTFKKPNSRINKFLVKIKNQLEWNMVMKFTQETFLTFMLCVVLQIKILSTSELSWF
jgi:hypothetical protein